MPRPGRSEAAHEREGNAERPRKAVRPREKRDRQGGSSRPLTRTDWREEEWEAQGDAVTRPGSGQPAHEAEGR